MSKCILCQVIGPDINNSSHVIVRLLDGTYDGWKISIHPSMIVNSRHTKVKDVSSNKKVEKKSTSIHNDQETQRMAVIAHILATPDDGEHHSVVSVSPKEHRVAWEILRALNIFDAFSCIQPSKAMLDAARDWSYKKYGKPIGNDDATGCWKAMFAEFCANKARPNV